MRISDWSSDVCSSDLIQMTERAAAQIQKMLTKRGLGETGLRLGVKAGGCSGFEYTFAWEHSPGTADLVVEGPDGAQVFVDPRRSEERRVGKEGVSTCRSRGSPCH